MAIDLDGTEMVVYTSIMPWVLPSVTIVDMANLSRPQAQLTQESGHITLSNTWL